MCIPLALALFLLQMAAVSGTVDPLRALLDVQPVVLSYTVLSSELRVLEIATRKRWPRMSELLSSLDIWQRLCAAEDAELLGFCLLSYLLTVRDTLSLMEEEVPSLCGGVCSLVVSSLKPKLLTLRGRLVKELDATFVAACLRAINTFVDVAHEQLGGGGEQQRVQTVMGILERVARRPVNEDLLVRLEEVEDFLVVVGVGSNAMDKSLERLFVQEVANFLNEGEVDTDGYLKLRCSNSLLRLPEVQTVADLAKLKEEVQKKYVFDLHLFRESGAMGSGSARSETSRPQPGLLLNLVSRKDGFSMLKTSALRLLGASMHACIVDLHMAIPLLIEFSGRLDKLKPKTSVKQNAVGQVGAIIRSASSHAFTAAHTLRDVCRLLAGALVGRDPFVSGEALVPVHIVKDVQGLLQKALNRTLRALAVIQSEGVLALVVQSLERVVAEIRSVLNPDPRIVERIEAPPIDGYKKLKEELAAMADFKNFDISAIFTESLSVLLPVGKAAVGRTVDSPSLKAQANAHLTELLEAGTVEEGGLEMKQLVVERLGSVSKEAKFETMKKLVSLANFRVRDILLRVVRFQQEMETSGLLAQIQLPYAQTWGELQRYLTTALKAALRATLLIEKSAVGLPVLIALHDLENSLMEAMEITRTVCFYNIIAGSIEEVWDFAKELVMVMEWLLNTKRMSESERASCPLLKRFDSLAVLDNLFLKLRAEFHELDDVLGLPGIAS